MEINVLHFLRLALGIILIILVLGLIISHLNKRSGRNRQNAAEQVAEEQHARRLRTTILICLILLFLLFVVPT